MKKITPNGIKKYLIENYGECRHDAEKLANACRQTAKNNKVTPLDIFHFVVESTPLAKLYTHSYGFHTSNGRALMEEFQSHYYN